MNYYIVVEDQNSPKVFRKWISYINPSLIEIEYPVFQENNFYFSRGNGYPNYLEIIIADIHTAIELKNVDRFIVCIDSENMTYDEKYQEIQALLQPFIEEVEIRIIVQHFCLEAWALGNQALIKKNPDNKDYRDFLNFYDVSRNDPELLPAFRNMNRSKFAFAYLSLACQEKYCPYSKRHPSTIAHPKYFNNLKQRRENTGHISSFQCFVEAFV
jgi:hypothetical protein